LSDEGRSAAADNQPPASARCQTRSEVKAPIENLSARCEHPGGTFHSDELVVSQLASRQEIFRWKPAHWRAIQGILWAPNGRSIALLNISSSWGLGPFEIVHALIGRPVLHDDVFLDVVDLESRETTEYLVERDVVRSRTRLSGWH